MPDTFDIFGRKLTVDSIDANVLRAKLLSGVETKTTNQGPNIDKLESQLNKLGDFQRELAELKRIVLRIAKCCERISSVRTNITRRKLDAESIAKRIKKETKISGHDPVSVLANNLKKTLNPAINDTVDELDNLNVRLAKAAGIMAKGFGESFSILANDLNKVLGGIFTDIKKGFANTSEAFGNVLGKVAGKVRDNWGRFVSWTERKIQDFGATIGGIASWTGSQWNRFTNWISEKVQGFGAAMGGVAATVKQAWNITTASLGKFIEPIKNAVGSAVQSIGAATGTITGWFGKLLSPIKEAAGDAAQSIGAVTGTVAGWFGKLLSPIKKAADDAIREIIGRRRGGVIAKESGLTGAIGTKEIAGTTEVRKPTGATGTLAGISPDMQALCDCICRCLGKPMQKMQVSQDRETAMSKVSNKMQSIGLKTTQQNSDILKNIAKLPKVGGKGEFNVAGMLARGGGAMAGTAASGVLAGITIAVTAIQSIGDIIGKSVRGFLDLARSGKPVEGIFEFIGNITTNLVAQIPLVGGLLAGFVGPVLREVTDELKHQRDINRIIYSQYGDIGKRAEEVRISFEQIYETGMSINDNQMVQRKLMRRGITDARLEQRIRVTALHTAAQIGAEAESTSELFADWSQHLGASVSQLHLMSRGILDVAKQTGVTGENLVKAAKSAQQFMERMRLSGTFTATAANNLIGLMARAQKSGTTQGMQNLLNVLQGSLLEEGGDERFRQLAIMATRGNVGLINALMGGAEIIQDRGLMAQFAEGLESVMMYFTRGRRIEDLSMQERGMISAIMRRIIGVGLQELNLIIRDFRQQSRSFTARMRDINNAIGASLTEEEARIQREELITNTSLEIMEKFQQALSRSGATVESAFMEVARSSSRVDLEGLMQHLQGDIQNAGDAIRRILTNQVTTINQQMQRLNLTPQEIRQRGLAEFQVTPQQIEEAIRSGDRTKIENIMTRLATMRQRLGAIEQERRDPIKAMENGFFATQAAMREGAAKIIAELAPLINKLMNDLVPIILDLLPRIADGVAAIFNSLNKIDSSLIWGALGFGALRAATGGVSTSLGRLGTSIGGVGTSLGRFSSAIGTVVKGLGLLSLAIGGALAIKELDDSWTETIRQHGDNFRNMTQRVANETLNYNRNVAELSLRSEEEIMRQRESAMRRVEAARMEREGLAGGRLAGRMLLQSIFSPQYLGFGRQLLGGETVETAIAATQLTMASEREGNIAAATAELALELRRARERGESEEQLRTRQIAGERRIWERHRNLAVAEIRWAENEVKAAQELIRGARGLQAELEDAWRRSQARSNLAKGWERLTSGGTTKEEREAYDILLRLGEQTRELYARQRRFFRVEAQDGQPARWRSMTEAGALLQSVVTEVDEAAAAQFRTARTIAELNQQWNRIIKPIREAYEATEDSAVGMRRAMELAQETARNLNAYDQARRRLIVNMMKDERGQWKSLTDATTAYREQVTVQATDQMQRIFERATTLREMDQILAQARAEAQREFEAAPDEAARIRILEQFASMQASYEAAHRNALRNLMWDAEQRRWADFGIATTRYRTQALTPQDINQEALQIFRGAKTFEELQRMYQERMRPLQEQYSQARTYIQSEELLRRAAMIQAAFEQVRGPLERQAQQAQSQQTIQIQRDYLNALTRNTEAIETLTAAFGNRDIATMARNATTTGSIFVHDIHLERLLENLLPAPLDLVNTILNGVLGYTIPSASPLIDRPGQISPLLPFLRTDEERIRMREAESQRDQQSLGEIQASSKETANNSKKMVILLNNLVRLLGRRRRSGGYDNVNTGQFDETPFFDEILDTEWPNSRQGRSVGIEFDLTDFS